MKLSDLICKRDEIINKYYNGVSLENLMKEYSCSWSVLYKILCVSFTNNYSILTEKDKKDILNMYLDGMSITKIGEKLKIHDKLIAKVLDKNGIKRVHNGKRKYILNESYFDKIDTPNKAYILGFLYADGYNSLKKSTISLSLECKDKEILEKIRKEIGSEKELEFIEQSKRKDKNSYSYKDMWRLIFFSIHMCNTLNNLGVTPNKSLTLDFPEWLDENLYSHFIRGYFDGDGCLCCHHTKDNKFQPLFSITSTDKFCKKCLDILRTYTNVGGGIYDASNKNGITKVLSVSGKHQIHKIFEWLYKDADLYMKRKHDIYINKFCPEL